MDSSSGTSAEIYWRHAMAVADRTDAVEWADEAAPRYIRRALMVYLPTPLALL